MKIIKTIKNKLKLHLLFTFLVAITLTSCSENGSDNEDNKQAEEELSEVVMQDFSSTLNDIQLPTSLAQSSNPYANLINVQMQSFKSLTTAFSSFFTVPSNALALKNGAKLKAVNTKSYSWTANGITVNYKITDKSDRYSFSFDIVSQSYSGNYMNGYQLKDGSVAEINYLNNGQEYLTLKWTNLDTIAKMEMNIIDGSKLLLESNLNDNSGNMKVYEEGKLTSSFVWKADGSGSFTDHIEGQTFTF